MQIFPHKAKGTNPEFCPIRNNNCYFLGLVSTNTGVSKEFLIKICSGEDKLVPLSQYVCGLGRAQAADSGLTETIELEALYEAE